MRIAVYGAGAVGGYLGAKLAEGGSDVTFIARGAHLEALRERGLTIVTPEGERSHHVVHAVGDPAEVGPVDAVLFLVKSYDTEEAAARLAPLLKADTAVLSLQNGIANEERIAAAIGPSHVLGGAVYILAAITEPGIVRSGKARIVIGELQPGPPTERVQRLVAAAQAGGIAAAIGPGHVLGGAVYILAAITEPGVVRSGKARIVIGEMQPGPPTERVQRLVAAAQAGGIAAEASSDVRVVKWEKYVLLVAFSAVTAATQLTIGDVRASKAASDMMRAVMTEAWQVGRALGIPLADDLVDRQHALVMAQKDSEATSLRHDLLTGHRMELDALQGTLRHLGRANGIATPWTDAAYAILEPWAIRNGATVTGA
jgi:2-dehydropantoate 2-reductase